MKFTPLYFLPLFYCKPLENKSESAVFSFKNPFLRAIYNKQGDKFGKSVKERPLTAMAASL
ncbi:hypothetical protein FD35_GL000606 [Furfurilactobacillus rossiae DSM 15814]|uniref:Uncharacterized protein n=1 Tax=Furfurilactobacillus rossiae DSM 15814 TaxID=1114972 RepID=A0A0R1RKP5_9LACO|nr:hypothetical protein FD35_GL000606 [Furfurilactobacillus rossiae DSM 15814]